MREFLSGALMAQVWVHLLLVPLMGIKSKARGQELKVSETKNLSRSNTDVYAHQYRWFE